MTTKVISPTANILRNSRLFSLPPPLPRPLNDLLGHAQSNKQSDTATLPYPVQQAIATPLSSLSRGDWGLKRPLPLRSTTKTSTPIFRINALDTLEHITDFESAADLSLTVQKFLDLNLPITTNSASLFRDRASVPRSVFEQELDNTDPKPTKKADSGPSVRWKYKGPWLAGMTQGDFNTFVKRELSSRKNEFRDYLRAHYTELVNKEWRRKQREQGHDWPDVMTRASWEEVAKYIKSLRSDWALYSELTKLISAFLDLPGMPIENAANFKDLNKASEKAPPTTHPSAGLTYLRTDAFLSNNPILGPQARPSPVEGRVLSGAKVKDFYPQSTGKLGVAGVVTNDPPDKGSSRQRTTLDIPDNEFTKRDVQGKTIGLGVPGGTRLWVEPVRASIDSRGRVDLLVAHADKTAVGVHTGSFNAPDLPARPTRVTRPHIKPLWTEYRNGMSGRLDDQRYMKGQGSSDYGVNDRDNTDGTDKIIADLEAMTMNRKRRA